MRKLRLDKPFRERERVYYREWYQVNGRNRAENYTEAIYEWRQEHPERVRAMNILERALIKGKISKPTACQKCGRVARLHGHHFDYADPLNIRWLCASCHKLEHNA